MPKLFGLNLKHVTIMVRSKSECQETFFIIQVNNHLADLPGKLALDKRFRHLLSLVRLDSGFSRSL